MQSALFVWMSWRHSVNDRKISLPKILWVLTPRPPVMVQNDSFDPNCSFAIMLNGSTRIVVSFIHFNPRWSFDQLAAVRTFPRSLTHLQHQPATLWTCQSLLHSPAASACSVSLMTSCRRHWIHKQFLDYILNSIFLRSMHMLLSRAKILLKPGQNFLLDSYLSYSGFRCPMTFEEYAFKTVKLGAWAISAIWVHLPIQQELRSGQLMEGRKGRAKKKRVIYKSSLQRFKNQCSTQGFAIQGN